MDLAHAPTHTLLAKLEQLVTHAALQLKTTFLFNPSIHQHKPALRRCFHLFDTYQTPLAALRLAYLASLSHLHIREDRLLTKRDVCYMCRSLFPNTLTVDRNLKTLSKLLKVSRNDLYIVAAPKGLVAGSIAYVDEMRDHVSVSMFGTDGCIIPPRPERMSRVNTSACAVVVLEKEATFHSLLNEHAAQQLLETCIFVTGKGYPDLATRMFLNRVSAAQRCKGMRLPIYVLTDADPHGISIAYCYISDLPDCLVQWVGVRPSDNNNKFRLNPASLLPITSTEDVLVNGMLHRIAQNESPQSEQALSLKKELLVLQATQTKFEMEALAIVDFESQESPLLKYLLERTQEEYVTTG